MATNPTAFIADVLPDARYASQATGAPVSVIIAQWANETGWGTSPAWLSGNNYAGVSSHGQVLKYSTRGEGLAAYVRGLMLPAYKRVRDAPDGMTAAAELAASPWAAGHYNGGRGLTSIIEGHGLLAYDQGRAPTDTAIAAGLGIPGLPNPLNLFGDVAGDALGSFQGWAGRVVIGGLIITGGVALVVLGGWRAVQPAAKRLTDATIGAAL